MNKLNVITMVTSGEWFEYHLRRFLWSAKKVMPDANYYVILVRMPGEAFEVVNEMRVRASAHFGKNVAIVDYDPKILGNLLFFDMVKAHALEPFKLQEGLFVDVDCDFIQSVEHLVDTDKDAEVLWVGNKHPQADIGRVLTALQLPSEPPYCDCGVVYMRKSFGSAFGQALNTLLANDLIAVHHEVAPGSTVWNVIIRQAEKHAMLPYGYNAMNWHCEELVDAHIIHFVGAKGKHERKFCDSSMWPRALLYHTTQVEVPLQWPPF